MPKQKKPVSVVRDQEYELVDVDELKPHPQNPNNGDVEVIRESIRVNGFYNAVKVQRSTGYILAGNTSWKAAVAEGLPEIPVIWLDVDDVEAIRILLVDNESARRAEYDEAVVDELLESLGSLEGTGFNLAELEAAERAREEAEREEEERLEQSKKGGEADEDNIPDDSHTDQWAVVVVLDSEDAQIEVFEEMKERGFTVRVVSV